MSPISIYIWIHVLKDIHAVRKWVAIFLRKGSKLCSIILPINKNPSRYYMNF